MKLSRINLSAFFSRTAAAQIFFLYAIIIVVGLFRSTCQEKTDLHRNGSKVDEAAAATAVVAAAAAVVAAAASHLDSNRTFSMADLVLSSFCYSFALFPTSSSRPITFI